MSRTSDAAVARRRPSWSMTVSGLVVLAFAVTLHAQRHGRADSAQNYQKGIPAPVLRITSAGITTRWKRDSLAEMPRSVALVPDGTRAPTRTFTGVPLSFLVPVGTTPRGVELYEIHHGFFHTTHLKSSELDEGSDLLVADRVDQKNIDAELLFCVIATTRDHQPIVIRKVTSIVITPVQRSVQAASAWAASVRERWPL
jgi:hypothetical protein